MQDGDIAISIRDLSKVYTITHNAPKHTTMGEALVHRLRHPLFRPSRETFCALKDICFDVKCGEVIGIIGRNGAGKSTLLKILSRITDPTAGRVELFGRVGSLLEVGTGFHPELTGRENIYLNGQILGMRRKEIDFQFDAIVDFAEVEQFLDTPVKRYSSGMYVRLAFAVAAHLSSEILIIDEVLAVGDAEFQKKCLGKMSDVARGGRTVLFVSHNMAAVSKLCSSAIVMSRGTIAFAGATSGAIDAYLSSGKPAATAEDLQSLRPAWATPLITSVKVSGPSGLQGGSIPIGEDVFIDVAIRSSPRIKARKMVLGVVVNNALGSPVGAVNMRMTGMSAALDPTSHHEVRCRLLRPLFAPGQYMIDVWAGDGLVNYDTLKSVGGFTIEPTDFYGTGVPPFGNHGPMVFEADWAAMPKLTGTTTLSSVIPPSVPTAAGGLSASLE